MKTANPALNAGVLANTRVVAGEGVMTVQGTVNKTLILFGIALLGAMWTWRIAMTTGVANVTIWLIVGSVAGLITAIMMAFMPKSGAILAPIYAIAEGLFLGALSAMFEMQYPGLVMQAVALTLGTMAALLVAYRAGAIKVTDKFRMGVMAATGGIALFYLSTFVLSLFGVQFPGLYGNGLLGIGFSLLVVGVAALNLVLDFDFIERASERGVPDYMEWYGAFGLMVTLVWLYVEILRLLSLFASRD